MRVPAQRCSRFKSRQACLNAMDPYCGWNEHKEQCTPAPNRDPLAGYWAQGVTQCPVLTAPGKKRKYKVYFKIFFFTISIIT